MASKHEEDLSNSPGCCESVFSAIICCSCQTNEDVSEHVQKHTNDHERVPVALSGQNGPAKTQKAEVAEKKHVQLPETTVAASTRAGGSRGPALVKSDTFADYIHRAKMKIRTMSNVGHDKNFTEADGGHVREAKQENSSKDVFSEYINRAKKKIRKTTSLGRE